jgi:transposase
MLADKAYVGDLEILLDLRFGIDLEIGSAEAPSGRFIPEPKRWIVERTIAWLNKCRRLVKNYEQKISSMKTWVYVANAFIGLKKIKCLA